MMNFVEASPDVSTIKTTDVKTSEIPKEIGENKSSNAEIPKEIGENKQSVAEIPKEIGESNSSKELNNIPSSEKDEVKEVSPIQNKIDGCRRESEVETDLKKQYPEFDGYKIESEVYLRDCDGNIVKDPETNEMRRIDFVITKDGKAIDSIEVTSLSSDKTEQLSKEQRIRDIGGNYIKSGDGTLVEIPSDVTTRVERRA